MISGWKPHSLENQVSMASERSPLVEGEDFYLEGPYMVFTAKYLSARGYCCKSGCRHCPYGYRAPDERQKEEGGGQK